MIQGIKGVYTEYTLLQAYCQTIFAKALTHKSDFVTMFFHISACNEDVIQVCNAHYGIPYSADVEQFVLRS